MLLPPYQQLSHFAAALASCLDSAIGVPESLETSWKALSGTRFFASRQVVVRRAHDGDDLATALSCADGRWPPFFLPVIRAGEMSGQLDEALRFLEHHCRLLIGPMLALRNAWLFPLCALLAGTLFNFMVYLTFASWSQTLFYLRGAVFGYAQILVVVVILRAPPLRPYVDKLRLMLPWISDVDREASLNRFFHVMAMVYGISVDRVEQMITTAAATVTNVAARRDLLGAADRIRQGESVAEAFDVCTVLQDTEKAMIATGDLGGKHVEAFERISVACGESLEHRLQILQMIVMRITMYSVMMSIAFCIATLLGAL